MPFEEPFAQGQSVLHRLDARAKLVCALVYACVVAVLRDARVLAAAVAFSGGLLLLARLDARRCAWRILVVNVFIAFLWLFVPWSVPGRVVAEVGPLHVTREGLILAARLTMRCNAIVLALIALLGTSRVADLARGLRLLRVPEKLVVVLFFCVRYVQVIHDEYRRLLDAARIRGFKPAMKVHTYRTYANFVGMLLVRSHGRAARIHEAMVCRGFNGRFPGLAQGRVRVLDVAAAGAVVAFALLLVGLEWMAMAQ
jgi:cobalt/nickel transport system permease protein